MKCPDCKGSGEYLPLIGFAEPCKKCEGAGELNDDGTVIDPKAKALDSVFNANLPSWMEDHKDEIDLNEAYLSIDIERLKEIMRNNPGTLQIDPGTKITDEEIEELQNMFGSRWQSMSLGMGDIIHVYDADWYEAEIVEIYQTVSTSSVTSPVTMLRADYTCGSFRIPLLAPCWNDTQKRWEYIKAGTPVWP